MQKTKSILVLCCLVVLLLPAAMPFILQMRIFLAREEAMEKLEDQNLEVIHLRSNQVQWTEEGRELVINGRLFDVRTLIQKSGGIEATGIFDDRETTLRQQIEDFWSDQQTKNNIILIKFFHVLGDSFFCKNDWTCHNTVTVDKTWSPFIPHQIDEIYIRILVPPPQGIS